MITEQDLQEAIAECQGKRNPDSRTCIMLAAFLIIKDHMYPDIKPDDDLQEIRSYSYAPPPEIPEQTDSVINYASDTDFGRMITGRKVNDVMPIIDELVSEPVRAFNPRLYDAFLRKLK